MTANHRSDTDSSGGRQLAAESFRGSWHNEATIGTAIVLTTAAVTGIEPTELPALSAVVDPDALEKIVQHAHTPTAVSFEYATCLVEIQSDGSVVVSPP